MVPAFWSEWLLCLTPQLFLPGCCSFPGLKNTELRDQIWNKDCVSDQSSSLKNKLHGMRYSIFKRFCLVKNFAHLLEAMWEMQLVNPWSSYFCTWISTSGWQLFIRWRDRNWKGFSSTPQLSQREIPSAFLFLLIGCFQLKCRTVYFPKTSQN